MFVCMFFEVKMTSIFYIFPTKLTAYWCYYRFTVFFIILLSPPLSWQGPHYCSCCSNLGQLGHRHFWSAMGFERLKSQCSAWLDLSPTCKTITVWFRFDRSGLGWLVHLSAIMSSNWWDWWPWSGTHGSTTDTMSYLPPIYPPFYAPQCPAGDTSLASNPLSAQAGWIVLPNALA